MHSYLLPLNAYAYISFSRNAGIFLFMQLFFFFFFKLVTHNKKHAKILPTLEIWKL